MQDIFGQPSSLPTAKALEHWNATQLAFLAHAAVTPTHLAATLDAAPHFAMGHAVKGMFYLLLGRKELIATAAEALDTAKAARATDPREVAYVTALDLWMVGQARAALAQFETILAKHPTDALAVKLDHALRFVLGDNHGMRRMLEQVLPAYGSDHPARGYLLGCHAFALEETGAYELARVTGRQALDLAPDDAWGLHAVAHVHDMTADSAGGIAWLSGREAAWAHCNNFRYHVWWHKALMHLDLGQVDVVFDLYDHEIRKDRTDDYRDISNATSLLSRLELNGIDVGHRWEELADISATRTEDGCLIFADLHYLLALVGDRREAEIAKLLGRLHKDARAPRGDLSLAMADPGVAAASGLEAFGEARFDVAFRHLSAARGRMQNAGGSHAQRDVFERLTIDAGIRAGALDAAETLLRERTTLRAGHEDAYTTSRHALITAGRAAADVDSPLAAE